MKVEIFSLADYAAADPFGKLTLVGIFNTIYSRQVPAIHGLCALAARIRFDRIEEGLKKVKISFVDSDGKAVLPAMETQMAVQFPINDQTTTGQIVTIVSQLVLPSFGEYSIDLAIDGRLEASTPLYVREVPLIPPPRLQKPTQSD